MTGSERRVVLWGEPPRVLPLKRNGVTDLGGDWQGEGDVRRRGRGKRTRELNGTGRCAPVLEVRCRLVESWRAWLLEKHALGCVRMDTRGRWARRVRCGL